MKFTVGLPFTTSPPNPEFLTMEAVSRLAQAAERAGFHSIFATEHPAPEEAWRLSGGHDALDPFIALTVVAAATQKLRLLTSLTVVPVRNPLLLAKTVATLDALSGGRLTLGVGTGYLESEYAALGVDFAERNDLFREAMEVLPLAFAGEPFDYEGRHFRAKNIRSLPTPVQTPGPPIWIGGNSKLARRRVIEWGSGWMPMFNPRALGARRRSAHLENLEDLAGMLQHLRELAEKAERSDPIDVLFSPLRGGFPGTERWRPQRYSEALDELAEMGVTGCAVRIPSDNLAHALDAIGTFGEDIIQTRPREGSA